MGRGAFDRVLRGGVAGRCAGRGFRRPARLFRRRLPHPRDPALRRPDQRRPQVHVGRARGGARQAGGGGQVRAPAAQRRGARRDPCADPGRIRCGVRGGVQPRRPAAGERARRTVHRRRDPGPARHVSGQPAGDPQQRRRHRPAGGGPAAGPGRHPGGAVAGHRGAPGPGIAAGLVARQSGGHHRRCRRRPLRRRGGGAAGRRGQRRAAGGQRPHRVHLVGRCGAGIDPHPRAALAAAARQTGVRGVAGQRRAGHRHPQYRAGAHLSQRGRGGARVPAPGALPPGAGGADGDAAQPAGRFRGGRRGRARAGGVGAGAWPAMAGPGGHARPAAGLWHPVAGGDGGARRARGDGAGAAAARAGRDRGGQGAVAGHPAQVRRRWRAPEPGHAAGGAHGGDLDPAARANCARRRASRACCCSRPWCGPRRAN